MKNNRKGFASIVLIGVFVALIGLGGYFSWSKKLDKTEPITSSTSQVDTLNWKTYRNNEYRFEFQYPAGHELYKSDFTYTKDGFEEHAVGFAIEDERYGEMDYEDTITFRVKAGIGSPEEFWETLNDNPYDERKRENLYEEGLASGRLKKIIFAGQPGFVDTEWGPYNNIWVYGKNDTYFIMIEQQSNAEMLSQILSTFKFTK